MAGSTTNYGATKPAVGEAYDVNITNNNSDIFDTQIKNVDNSRKAVREAEYTGPSVVSTAGAGVNFGQMTVDATRNFNNTFVTPNGATGLKILETGTYQIVHKSFPDANPGLSHVWATRTGSVSDNLISMNFSAYGSNQPISSASFYAVVNDVIQCGITTTNTVNTGSRIQIVKIQG